ncbi:MAG: helix-turn-helix domain-containing protein, partial [Anaerolineae bacterium]|nr:helix-turn-helix domain-containing protein [Anaerolineae bacterium]
SLYDLPDLGPRAAYQLLYDLAVVTDLLALEPERGEALPRAYARAVESYTRARIAFRALMDWPLGFYELLDRYRQEVRDRQLPSGPLVDLGPLYLRLQRRWQDPAFTVVQQAFDDYFVDHYDRTYKVRKSEWYLRRPGIAERFRFLTYTEAARILNVAPQTLTRLVRSGRLRRYPAQDADHYLFLRADIQQLAQDWSATLTMTETAERLGVSRVVVRDLIQSAMLIAERGPTTDETAQWKLSQSRVELLETGMALRRLPEIALEGYAVDLAGAARMVAVVGMNAASLLQAAVEGELPSYGPLGAKPGEIWLTEYEVGQLIERVKQRQGWVDREAVARRMGVKVTAVSRWIRHGLLAVVAVKAGAEYLDVKAVDTFVEGHLFTETAATLLGVTPLTIQKWARRGRLQPVSGPNVDDCHRYLFPRAEILKWCDTEVVTAPELARRLGMSHSQVLVWTHEGKLQPVSGPGVDQCKQYLFRWPVSVL